LLIDLYGCGDSDGESGDASWEAWKDDLALAVQWLQQRLHVRPGIWALRLGALLALDFAQEHADEIGSLLLWNPVLNGQNFLTQFLRLQLAGEMMSGDQSAAQPGKSKGTVALRDMLQAGRTLEIAGYDISPALALRLDSLDAMKLKPTASALHWLEIVRSEDTPLPAAQARLAAHWQQQNVALDLRTLSGPAFWSTPETTTSPSLIELSCALALADSEQSA
jgi:exosortase A-associated hydrolase 2